MTKKGETGNFFFHFAKKKKVQYFPTKKIKYEGKKKKIAAARLATILATRWTVNILFYGQPHASSPEKKKDESVAIILSDIGLVGIEIIFSLKSTKVLIISYF